MKRITQLFLCWILVFVSGCTPVAKLFYGVKQPGYETESSIKQFVTKVGLPEAPVYSQKFESWKADQLLHNLDVFVFSKDGKYIPYKDSLKPNCSGPAELFLSYLDPATSYYYSDELTLSSVYSKLNTLDCFPAKAVENAQVDFYIFTTFAKWQGKHFLKKKTLLWLDTLQQNKKITYELILVNTDLQDCWSDSQKAQFEK